MAEQGVPVNLVNRVRKDFDSSMIQSSTPPVVGLGAVGGPEYTLGLLDALARATTIAQLGAQPPNPNLALWLTAVNFAEAKYGGVVVSAALLDAVTEIRAQGEIQISILAGILAELKDPTAQYRTVR